MAIVNGKIIRDKPKKKKGIIEEQKDKATKRLRDKALGKKEKKPNKIQEGFDKFKKENGVEKPKSDKKKSKKKVSEDFIRTGDNSGLRIELSEYNGKEIVAVRKLYCTKADPEMKVGSGGFNLPQDKKILKALIAQLQEVCDSL